jgi:hypothetical protein
LDDAWGSSVTKNPLFSRGDLQSRVATAVDSIDYLRRSPHAAGGPGSHKEWLHFVVHAEGMDLLVNFSVVDDTRIDHDTTRELPRIVVLVRDRGWDGAIELFATGECEIARDRIRLRYGDNRVEFRDGVFYLHGRLRHRPIRFDLALRPLVVPAPCNNIRLELDRRPINWMVVPRLVAHGSVEIHGRVHRIDDAPAYHDHNWGHFQWGGDFAWEWGFALPVVRENPWSVVYVRLSNRTRTRCYKQGLFLWHGESIARVLREFDMRVTLEGLLRTGSLFKLPGVMNVIDPGCDADVPRVVECRAEGGGDVAEFRFEAEDVAQVCIPNDTDDDGLTIINEVSGRMVANGVVGGHRLSLEGPGMFEFVRGA